MSVRNEDIQDLLDKTEQNIKETTVRALSQERSFQAFWDVMGTALGTAQKLDEMILGMYPERADLACQNGCSNCCMLKVVTQPMFVVFAWLYAQENNNGHAYSIAKEAYESGREGCQFLDQDSCSIYLARPMACRLFHSYDFQACLNGEFQNATRLGNRGIAAAQAGLNQGFKALGLECHSVLFKDAFKMMVEQENLAADWLRGKPVFQACYHG